MPKSLTRTQDTLSPSLLAFKPRQLLLANLNLEMKQSNPNNSAPTLSPHQKGPLLYAVARFLQGNGFSKTLKKFLSEAPIEKNGLKDSSLDLEEMYCKYSEMCNKDNASVNSQKENGNDPAPEKIAKSKDKKKNRKTFELLNQGDEQVCTEELKKPEQVEEADKNGKEKKKKKGKIVSDTPDGVEQRKLEPLSVATEESLKDHTSVKGKGVGDSETEKKSKDKKKKKNKSNDDSVSPNVEQGGVEAKQDANGTSETIADENLVDIKPKVKKNKKVSSGGEDKKVVAMGDASDSVLKKEDFKLSDVEATNNENKCSKKRKRLDSEGNDSEPGKSKEDESAEKSSMQKSIKKQCNGSTEPKTINAFQRVKLDEVVFTDEKLKDNSYWAKDGAEIGYGAKAQEILGQVRGRDFRHEKTKKKRGTYRGGQIDLQSHSVKFNYSDED
ncbi:suppressor protein SRP40 [Rosa rugosa]|uniref:suppressor protein SRP40 n=1 Tax=Rosa rugosa TaxID=74645 RepID=UPI002B40CEC6|nr:suppressor protein SRP40 [Rosa rugosa]